MQVQALILNDVLSVTVDHNPGAIVRLIEPQSFESLATPHIRREFLEDCTKDVALELVFVARQPLDGPVAIANVHCL